MAQPLVGGMRALVVGSFVALVASLLALAASRGTPTERTEWAAAPLRPAVPVTSPSSSPSAPVSPSVSASAPAPSSPSAARSSSRAAPTTRPPRAGFSAEHRVTVRGNDGHVARVTVRNTGTATGDWTVVLVLDQGVRMQRAWVQNGGSAQVDQDGNVLRFSGRTGAGATLVVDYLASRSRGADDDPRSCTINGSPCR